MYSLDYTTTNNNVPLIIKELISGTPFVLKEEFPTTIPCSVVLSGVSGKEVTLEITDQNPWKEMGQAPDLGIYVPGERTSYKIWVRLDGKIFELDEAVNMVPKILRSKNR